MVTFLVIVSLALLVGLSSEGPVQGTKGKDIAEEEPLFPHSDGEPVFGERLNRVTLVATIYPTKALSVKRAQPPPRLPPPPPIGSSMPPPVEMEEFGEPPAEQQQRSLLTGDPIFYNMSEGVCQFEGKIYSSGENIERKHLCHFCFCRNGYIDCYWKNCPIAPEGCLELSYEGVCERSLYLCPIPKKDAFSHNGIDSSGNRGHISKRQSTYENFTTLGCDILGVRYRIGELVGVATDPCLECRCALDALYCSPKCCFQPAEPNDDIPQQIQRSDDQRPVLSNPLLHLRSEFHRSLSSP